jgi:Fe-S cluster assembly ATP-binding protein|tara:strand:+ start:19370 stop:20122 length:753 start_codon:yes stop_codon:yes gene_type:complete
MNEILNLKNLNASIEQTPIIKNFNLDIKENEIHVIMGPNGSGKSTLSKILAGHPSYSVNSGEITFCNQDLLELDPETRSHEGLFLAFQYPIEIAGVTNYDFLRIAYNEKQKYLKQPELDPLEFMSLVQELLTKLKMRNEFLNRNLNEGFSGGEKKRNEILQMLLLDPKLVILDEIDSGLDVDALKIICEGINDNLKKDSSLVIITHYPRILQYLKPTHVHIMMDGKIIKTGNMELVQTLEAEGYNAFVNN